MRTGWYLPAPVQAVMVAPRRPALSPASTMRIGKPLLITVTAIGLPIGIYEGFHLAGPLGFVMVMLIGLFGAGIAWTISIAREEERERRRLEAESKAPD